MTSSAKSRIYAFDRFQVDAQRRLLLQDGKPVILKSKAFDLLLVLVESRGGIEKDDLMSLVWQDQIVEENNLTVHMSALRKVLGERKGDHRFIVTIPTRYGFCRRYP